MTLKAKESLDFVESLGSFMILELCLTLGHSFFLNLSYADNMNAKKPLLIMGMNIRLDMMTFLYQRPSVPKARLMVTPWDEHSLGIVGPNYAHLVFHIMRNLVLPTKQSYGLFLSLSLKFRSRNLCILYSIFFFF